ncbi:MAG TPA: hypothetical protein VHP11_05720, partial [Tepidisphaeraceae bacterium]|nr:hypothetical protein [Tepidisphaeraceae bacterium]
MPQSLARLIVAPASVLLIGYALRPRASLWRLKLTVAVASVSLLVVIWNVLHFYFLLARGYVRAGVLFPFSLLIALGLGFVVLNIIWHGRTCRRTRGYWLAMAGTLAICVAGFPLAQMY